MSGVARRWKTVFSVHFWWSLGARTVFYHLLVTRIFFYHLLVTRTLGYGVAIATRPKMKEQKSIRNDPSVCRRTMQVVRGMLSHARLKSSRIKKCNRPAQAMFLQIRYILGNRYSSCNLQTRENRLLGIAPNDSPSKTALGNGLADKIRRFKSRSRFISVTVARLHRDRDCIEIEISKNSEKTFLTQFSTRNRMVLFPEAHSAGNGS